MAEATRVFAITVSFGSVHSSISLPLCMSHASIPQNLTTKAKPPAELVRLSVGIEDPSDLIEDLDNALKKAVESQPATTQATPIG